MNPELHHKWNAERDGTRGSGHASKGNPADKHPESKVLLKQNRPKNDVR